MGRPTVKKDNQRLGITVEAETKTFLQEYSKRNGISTSGLIDAFAASLRAAEAGISESADSISIQSEVAAMSVLDKTRKRRPSSSVPGAPAPSR